MSVAADALQPLLVKELLVLRGRAAFGHFSEIITNAPGAGYDIDFDEATNQIRIDFRESAFLGAAIGSDASRFAGAAFSSFKGLDVHLDDASSLAWGLVRAYYSAFYAGHALIRLLGRTCTQIESSHLNRIKNIANALGKPVNSSVSAGLFVCELNPTQTGFEMRQARGRVGGAHEAFWEVFDGFVSEITEDVLRGRIAPADARAVFLKLDSFRKITKRASGASWLSTVRNEIQYRHARGVWAPSVLKRRERGVLSRTAAQWKRDPMTMDIDGPPGGDIGAYVMACTFLTALCREVLRRVADRSSAGVNSFARFPLRLCD
ncbi:MAG: hypothetical protein ACE37J_12475 [Pikeienuella sp.]|uniref:hypothetical protein n=1 Tax=Pikeienuella sp. TaxID=2831957 RepID=UPI00391AB3F6